MKKLSLIIALFTMAFVIVDDIFTRTGTHETAIKKSIVNAALYGSDAGIVPQYNANETDVATAYKVTRGILLNQRGAIVTEIGNYFKKYYGSADFKKDFNDALQSFAPGEAPKDSASLKAGYDSNYNALTSSYENLKQTYDRDKLQNQTNTSINASQDAIDQLQKMLKEHPELAAKSGMSQEELAKKMQEAQTQVAAGKKQANEEFAKNMSKEQVAENLKQAEEEYNKAIAQLKTTLEEKLKSFPADRKAYNEKVALYQKRSNYKLNLKSSLQHFLDATTDIDFSATLVRRGNIDYFTNPVYEKKNNLWKACFRAGKDAGEAAKNFTEQWIKEIK